MEVPYNHTTNWTYTNIFDFEHNETNCLQNYNCTTTGSYADLAYLNYIELIVYWIIFFITLPGICYALYKIRSQMTSDRVVPVYVINLLISDLIQICTNAIQITLFLKISSFLESKVSGLIYLYGLQVNIFFMMCISAERYMMIAHAVLYRNIQRTKTSVIVSVMIWILSTVFWIAAFFSYTTYLCVMGSVLLVPYPLVMFFFVATWRALSRTSVPHNDQMRIMATLALVLCIYTILFLPLFLLIFIYGTDFNLYIWARILVALNPLFDPILYVFIRRDVKDVFRALLFCFNKRPEANRTNV